MILPIVAYGQSVLREKCTEAENTPETQKLITDLKDTLIAIPTAVGLAAPQINSPVNIFGIKPSKDTEIKIFVNPIIRKRRMKQKSEEGCLSIPSVYGEIPQMRDDIIDVEYYDESFNKQRIKLRGFSSIVYQHEAEHLLGILFIDHFTKEGREQIREKLNEIESGKIQTVYPMIFK